MIPPIYYQVNGKVIFNDLLAKHEAYTSGKPVEFYCHNNEYDQLDWTQEPSQSMDQLMDDYARHLRNSYERVILSWSGGTDSHTIYQVFVRNNLHIDEIIVWHNEEFEPWYSNAPVEWINKNHKDPLTKITPRSRFDPDAKSRIITDEDWIFQNRTLLPKFSMGMYDTVTQEHCEKNHGHTTWCLINGHEQPRVYLRDGKYYSHHISMTFLSVMGADNSICFFTEPLLALKQSHLIKRTLKRLASVGKYDQTVSDRLLNGFEHHMKLKTQDTYTAWQRSIGRLPEAVPGLSYFQKNNEGKFEYMPVRPAQIDGTLSRAWDLGLDVLLKKDNAVAQTFERGIKNLLLEKNFCEHLMSTTPYASVISKQTGYPVFSKSYLLE